MKSFICEVILPAIILAVIFTSVTQLDSKDSRGEKTHTVSSTTYTVEKNSGTIKTAYYYADPGLNKDIKSRILNEEADYTVVSDDEPLTDYHIVRFIKLPTGWN